jgi:hypothetical protein
MASATEVYTSKPSQFSMAAMLIFMFGFSIVFAGIARLYARVELAISFNQTPEIDAAPEK